MAIYLEFDGIKGNVTAEGFKDQIALLSCNFGVSRGISMEPGNLSNREATRPSLSEISISKETDTSAIALFKESVTGDAGKTVKIRFVRTGADKVQEYLIYELENCLVSSYSISANGDDSPIENLTLSYSKLLITYKDTDEKLGVGSQQVAGYSLTQGKPV